MHRNRSQHAVAANEGASPSRLPLFGGQVIRYLLVGVANTLVGLGCIFIALAAFGLGPVAANIVGYAIAAGFSYLVNRAWTFAHRGAIGRSMWRYAATLGVAFACNLGVLLFCQRWLGLNLYAAQLCGMASYTVVAFIGSRYFAFASR